MHRNKLLRRVLALALVFCMVLTTVPAAFAAENSQFTDVNANHWAYPYIPVSYTHLTLPTILRV